MENLVYYQGDLVTIYLGDCRDILPSIRDVSAVVTDPPYELRFMGKSWDSKGISFQKDTWQLIRESCLSGAMLLSFGGTRTFHRIACAIEDAGWEIRDTIMWVYGCLSEDTEILTKRGYMPYHKLTKYDIILVYDVENDIYKWETPQRWQVYRVLKDTVYRITSDNTDQLVSRNHNCLIKREGKLIFTKAEALADMETMPILPSDFLDELEIQGSILFSPMQRDGSWSRMESLCSQGQVSVDARKRSQLSDKDERGEQSSVERWGNIFQDTRQLYGGEVYSLPYGILGDGSEGRLCNGASPIGSPANRATLVADRGSSPQQSRPDRQQSDSNVICQQHGTQTLRSGTSYKTTLARVYPEQYSGIIYCPTVSTGAFVARRNGKIFITGNSGFPKSLDVSKAIDKNSRKLLYGLSKLQNRLNQKRLERKLTLKEMNGLFGVADNSGCAAHKFCDKSQPQFPTREQMKILDEVLCLNGELWELYSEVEREIIGRKRSGLGSGGTYALTSNNLNAEREIAITTPATPEAKLWEGYGTGLKPAYEPILVCMNPLDGTFANNALKYGIAGLNIDESRIPFQNEKDRNIAEWTSKGSAEGWGLKGGAEVKATNYQGRFPSNLIHDGSPEVMGLFPNTKTGDVKPHKHGGESLFGMNKEHQWVITGSHTGDSGSAARFFYCAKASRAERDAGLEDMPLMKSGNYDDDNYVWDETKGHKVAQPSRNSHQTVKPLSLMTYLVKLVKMPEHNLILDPFCGSGTTLLACKKLGIKCIGIDSDEKACEISAQRCSNML